MSKKFVLTNAVVLSTVRDMVTSLNAEMDDRFTNAEVVEKLDKMIEQLEKKSGYKSDSPKKPTAQQEQNEGYKYDILRFLADGEGKTISEIWKGIPALNDNPEMTSQRISALITQMKYDEVDNPDGRIIREPGAKGKPVFRLR